MSYVHSSSLDNNYLTPDGDSLPAYVATAPPLSSGDLTIANAAVLAAHFEAHNPAGPTATETIMSLFDSISSADDSSVAHILSSFPSLVNPNSRQNGKTALVAAVETGNIRMVEMLINMGADLDLWRRDEYPPTLQPAYQILRTPLMIAAEKGYLPIVKLLLNPPCNADHTLCAPDGQIALRLAVENGHREVVDFLPSLRKGGFRRLKYAHATSVYRIKETTKVARILAAFLVWHIPKAVLYNFPKWIAKTAFRIVCHVITKSIPKAAKATWRGMVKSGRYLRDDLPGAICRKVEGGARAIKKFVTVIVPKAAKATGNFLWMLIVKWIPNAIKQTCKFAWKLLTVYIPRALYEIISSIWDVIKFIGWFIKQLVVEWFPTFCKAVANGLKAFAIGSWDLLLRGLRVIASLLHTIFEMIISFFRRISLRDVWNAVLQVLKWIFVEVPVGIGKVLKAVYRGVVKGVEKMFGWWGKVLVFLWEALVYAVLYLPRSLGAAFVDYSQVLVKGVKEVLVWFNPKR
ncbi:hypothetical protein L211DRAFT_775824 [Terfezia boudieri ATCC MYA-4762]|uniref:Uncharacterized protein n=1 Tax=Terfezia boudieri ATCC MYA-4762 TaxID=1051890 RepID=A0A3N4M2E7_9PEZI|nr:hypothetical protein L211DRAFT_775824 [Terfezia boudieri ATCC MYA-4762]